MTAARGLYTLILSTTIVYFIAAEMMERDIIYVLEMHLCNRVWDQNGYQHAHGIHAGRGTKGLHQ